MLEFNKNVARTCPADADQIYFYFYFGVNVSGGGSQTNGVLKYDQSRRPGLDDFFGITMFS